MTLSNISLSQHIVGKLRQAVVSGDLEDYNTNRTASYGNWIYSDAPMLTKLLGNVNNFPRISIESLSYNFVEEMGMADPNNLINSSIKINVWSVRGLVCTVKSTANEAIPYDATETTYALANLPTSEITAVDSGGDTFVKGTDYQLIDDDGDGFYDAIEWLGVDTPVDGADFNVDYKRVAAGSELVRLIAQDVNVYLRTWRDWSERVVWSYRLLSSVPIPFDEQFGIFRHEITVQFTGINIGETI